MNPARSEFAPEARASHYQQREYYGATESRHAPSPPPQDDFGRNYRTPSPAVHRASSSMDMNSAPYPPYLPTDSRSPPYPPHYTPVPPPDTYRDEFSGDFSRAPVGNGDALHGDSGDGKEIIIALMGVTGSGKSYFIRKVSGLSEVEIGDGLESCTATIKVYTFMCEGTKVTLVDTPGFNDTHRSDTDVLKEIVAWTSSTYKEKRLLSGIIYLHRISDVRMEGSALKNLRMFQKLCGENALHNVLLTTTQWSKVEPRQGEARESELKAKKDFWKPLLDRGANLERFYGDMQSGLALIHKLKSRVPKVLDIQEQIVDKKMDLIETSAGQTINEELLKLQKKYSEELKTTRQELQAALNSKDEELKVLLAEQQEKEERRLAQIEAERKDLMARHETEMKKREEEMRRLEEEARRREQETRRELTQLRDVREKQDEQRWARQGAQHETERNDMRQLLEAQQKAARDQYETQLQVERAKATQLEGRITVLESNTRQAGILRRAARRIW